MVRFKKLATMHIWRNVIASKLGAFFQEIHFHDLHGTTFLRRRKGVNVGLLKW